MNVLEIIRYRLAGQQLAGTTCTGPQEIVRRLGAVQAQVFSMAKWAIGLRLPGSRESDIDRAFNEGKILRTHLLRPTWHFVSPQDIRWMLALSAPRVHAANAFMYRQLELDKAVFKKSNATIVKMLRDGNHLTRDELNTGLKRAKIIAGGPRLSYLMMFAELEGIICSGPRKGKQFTYALIDEHVPATKKESREESLGRLTEIYFSSRGPATIADYCWWSGLTVKDAKTGIALLSSKLTCEKINDREHYFVPADLPENKLLQTFLMPDYDEYGIGYKDRSAMSNKLANQGTLTVYSHLLIIDGIFGGTWDRTEQGKKVAANVTPFFDLDKAQRQNVAEAVKKYDAFFAG
ncbi:MAG: hypothetical protein FD123_150 [Bacteroidetes bacterium]|nr:MAG: hypothetical protein FD123_150 [Bacteroidota bacterium]